MLKSETVRKAAKAEKPYKLYDERGLFLLVNKNGSKLWRFKYRFDKQEKLLALGPYPEIKISEARVRRESARSLVAKGIDRCEQRQAEKAARVIARAGTFKAVAPRAEATSARRL